MPRPAGIPQSHTGRLLPAFGGDFLTGCRTTQNLVNFVQSVCLAHIYALEWQTEIKIVGFGDSIRMGLSDAVNWASEKAAAGAKMVGEVASATKDAVVKTAEVIASPLISTVAKEVPKPATLATTVQGVNSSFTDKVAYAWKKTTDMATSLGTYAAMLSPVAGGVVAASKLINVGHNLYQDKVTGDRVQILDKDKSITSVLKDSAWQTALTKSADGKKPAENTPSIDTDKLIGGLPMAQSDNGSTRRIAKDEDLTAHVTSDQWKRIFSDMNTANVVPEALVDSEGIMVRANNTPEAAKEGEVKVGAESAIHDDKKGRVVKFDAKNQHFQSRSEADKSNVEVNRTTGAVELTADGKGYRVVGNMRIWDVNDNQTVENEVGTKILKVFDKSHNLMQIIDKENGTVRDFRGDNEIVRGKGKICDELRQWRDQRRADRKASGLVLGAAQDGIFMQDKDGTAVVLQTDGNAFFELSGGVKIWKDASDKYYIIEAGKEPQPILDGSTGKAVETQAREYLDLLKGWANENTFTRNGVKFTNDNGKLNVEMEDKTKLETGPDGLTLTAPDRTVSALNTLTNEFTIGEGDKKSTFKLDSEVVDTPYVHTDELGTKLKKTGDWVGHNLEVKLADGTHYTAEGNVYFADGTVFHKNGDVTAGSNVRLAADIQEQQIKQAASVLRNAEAIADAVKAKAASGLINYSLIAQLEGSISQVGALMAMFSGNDAIRARLAMVMASLESARSDAKTSFAANTALRATRDAALATNKVKPESVALTTGYNPELKMQFRIGKIDRYAA